MTDTIDILKIYQAECDVLYIHFKNQAERETALGKTKQRVRKKDIEAFASLARAYGKQSDDLSDAHLATNPKLKQELSRINKTLGARMAELGRALALRVR